MKKGRILAIAVVVLMVVGALVLASCGLGCPGGGNVSEAGNCRGTSSYGSVYWYHNSCSRGCIMDRATVSGTSLSCNC